MKEQEFVEKNAGKHVFFITKLYLCNRIGRSWAVDWLRSGGAGSVVRLAYRYNKVMLMDFVKMFKKGGWLSQATRFVGDRSKLGALAVEAARYASEKESLYEAKSDFVVLCDYVRDVATGRYKGYKLWHLTVIVAAIIYVLSPIDIIPDFLVGGFIDDLSIVAWAIAQAGKELKAYRESRLRLPNLEEPLSEAEPNAAHS